MDLLNRAIRCGAVLDPWNLLGFDAQFSLFPALENSVHDHRADELVALMETIFGFFSRIWSAAAAEDKHDLCQQIRQQFRDLADWWRQFAAHEVSSVDAVDADEIFRAAQHVAESLNLWHKGGAATGDVKFWVPYAHLFDSPKSFSLVIEALLERDDFVASMSLLIHWLSVADDVPLEQGVSSFHQLSQQWLLKLLHGSHSPIRPRAHLGRRTNSCASSLTFWRPMRASTGNRRLSTCVPHRPTNERQTKNWGARRR